jgi:hypothetical protein
MQKKKITKNCASLCVAESEWSGEAATSVELVRATARNCCSRDQLAGTYFVGKVNSAAENACFAAEFVDSKVNCASLT